MDFRTGRTPHLIILLYQKASTNTRKCGGVLEHNMFVNIGINISFSWKCMYRCFCSFLLEFSCISSCIIFCEDWHQEMIKIPVKNLENLGYNFHIYQNTWRGNLEDLQARSQDLQDLQSGCLETEPGAKFGRVPETEPGCLVKGGFNNFIKRAIN